VSSFFGSWFDSYNSLVRLNVEAQQVIGLRIMKMARGGRHAEIESQRMISEKLAALTEAQVGLLTDIATGQGMVAPARAIAVFQREVSANRRRLSR
jgi:hypothetical protein